MSTKTERLEEDAPVMNAGSGSVAGLGVGPNGEPGVPKKRQKFAGHEVFDVDADRFLRMKEAKSRYEKYSKYVGEDETGEEIRQWGRENPSSPIILRCSRTGAMTFLKYGSK